MKRIARKLVPLSVRKSGKLFVYSILDVVKPIKAERVPPRRDIFIGGPNFIGVGNEYFEILKSHGLSPEMRVLDVGCGQGRMARPMVGFFSDDGGYDGFDIEASGIEWCQKQYADRPEFRFRHADVLNPLYNPSGGSLARDYVFPYPDNSFDFIFLTSVFTHMLKADVENYISEIKRVSRPGARVLITWFLLNDETRAAPDTALDFVFPIDDVSSTSVREHPEESVAYDEAYVRGLYAELGFSIVEIERGTWSGLGPGRQFQDLVVATTG